MRDVVKRVRGKIAHSGPHDAVSLNRDDVHLLIRYIEEFEKLSAYWDQPVPTTQNIAAPVE